MSTITQATPATIVDRVPSWATAVELQDDGYVVYTRAHWRLVQVHQSSHLVLDQEAGTVSYQPADGLQLWVPDIDKSVSPEIAREMPGQLQELLTIVEQIEAGA